MEDIEKVFNDKIINVWNIVYDFSGENMYVFSDFEAVKNAVIGSIWSYCTVKDDDPAVEMIVEYITDILNKSEDVPCIPISIDNLSIVIYRFTIDNTHIIHKVLAKCFNQVDDDLQEDIKRIFNGELSNRS